MNQILLTPKEWIGVDIYEPLGITENEIVYIDYTGGYTKESRIFTKYNELIGE